jgi:HD-GYP domain-containing protein (c-di-GMP phosphodiesterase class II)
MAAAGSPLARMLQIPFSWAEEGEGRGAIGNAIRTGTAQVLRDVTENPLLGHIHDYAREMGIATVLALPLFVGTDKRPLGVIVVMSMERGAFDDEEMRLLQELANDLAYGILTLRTRAERGIATEKLRTSLEESIQAIAATVEMRDPYTAGHQQRVAQLAAAIGREMGLDEERIHGLHLAGIVHDLGKISVPAEILSKPGRLTELELGLVREHARSGHEILKGIDFPWPIARMVLEHHERLDGSGYPQGLKGDAILPESRILTVADVVEAMSSHRPYRPGLGVDRALAEIETNRGRLYDAEAADACLRLFRERRFSFR